MFHKPRASGGQVVQLQGGGGRRGGATLTDDNAADGPAGVAQPESGLGNTPSCPPRPRPCGAGSPAAAGGERCPVDLPAVPDHAVHGACHEEHHTRHRHHGAGPREPAQQSRPVVAGDHQRRHPRDRADRRAERVAADVHPRGARDQRGQRAHPRDPAGQHHRPPAVPVQEVLCLLQAFGGQHPRARSADQGRTGSPADVVADEIARHGDDDGGGGQRPRVHRRVALGQHDARGEQQGVAGQEQADDERAFDEHEREHDQPHHQGARGLQVVTEGEQVMGGMAHHKRVRAAQRVMPGVAEITHGIGAGRPVVTDGRPISAPRLGAYAVTSASFGSSAASAW